MHAKYPNTDAANWRDITPEDATPEELNLVYQISGPRPKHITPEQWRDNMRACAKSIRAHRAEVPDAVDHGALLTKWDTYAGDSRWNGHISSTYAACAADLRAAIGSKPDSLSNT